MKTEEGDRGWKRSERRGWKVCSHTQVLSQQPYQCSSIEGVDWRPTPKGRLNFTGTLLYLLYKHKLKVLIGASMALW